MKHQIPRYILILGVFLMITGGCRLSQDYYQQESSSLREKVHALKKELKACDSADISYKHYLRTGADEDYDYYLNKHETWVKIKQENEEKGYH